MAITRVQAKGVQSSGAVANQSVTLDAPTAAGSLLVVSLAAWEASGSTDCTISDDRGNTYTEAVGRTAPGSHTKAVLWYAKAAIGGVASVTVTPPAGAAYLTFAVSEYSGADATAPLDDTAGGDGFDTAPATVALTSTVPGVVVGCMAHGGGAAMTPGAGWSEVYEAENASNQVISAVDRLAPAGTYTAGWTLNASEAWRAVAAAFKESAGGGPGAGLGGSLLGGSLVGGSLLISP